MLLTTSLAGYSQHIKLFVGTYTNTGSKGIYVYDFNVQTGNASLLSSTDGVVNPSFVAISPNKKYLFAVNETHGSDPGKVSSFAINDSTGRLTFLSQQLTGGDDPCYVSVHKSNNWIAVGNYSSGNASVFKVKENGHLEPYSQLVQDTGKGTNPKRQEKPHVHSTVFSPDYNYLFTPDLGIDKIMAYRFDESSNQPLKPTIPSFVATNKETGPRHLIFHPNGNFGYLIGELSGTVTVYRYQNGRLIKVQEIATHPAGFKGDIGGAEVRISPDGKFLYASNRGDENSITIFALNAATGRLQLKGFQPVMGKVPRNFAIDPTGNYLLVANQNTDNVVIFKRNKTSGLLTYTGRQFAIPRPVCLKFLPL